MMCVALTVAPAQSWVAPREAGTGKHAAITLRLHPLCSSDASGTRSSSCRCSGCRDFQNASTSMYRSQHVRSLLRCPDGPALLPDLALVLRRAVLLVPAAWLVAVLVPAAPPVSCVRCAQWPGVLRSFCVWPASTQHPCQHRGGGGECVYRKGVK